MKRELRLNGTTVLATRVDLAESLWTRFLGLMGRGPLPDSYALVLSPCNQIHMFFMRIPLDVAFVDRKGRVLHLCPSIKPWRMSRMVAGAAAAIEVEAGLFARHDVAVGDTIELWEGADEPQAAAGS